MQLSQHFSLDEFLVSEWMARRGFMITPSDADIENLTRLCRTVLEPLRRDLSAPIVVTSGLRPVELNTAIGGSKTSDHITGSAADIRAIGCTPLFIAMTVEELKLPVKQVIHEFGRWVHLSVPPDGAVPGMQALTATAGKNGTEYNHGIHPVNV